MTFSMPSPVELTQLKIQYQRKVGTASASNRIELGATAPAPGSTSSASTFLSATTEDYETPRARPRVLSPARGHALAAPSPQPPHSSMQQRTAARGPGGPRLA